MSLSNYVGKEILAWLSYNKKYEEFSGIPNKVFYVYPRVLLRKTDFVPIDKDDFPTLGRIQVLPQGG